MVIRLLIDKMVKKGKQKLYACFFDVKKAFDCTNREILFKKLLTEYGVGGNFLFLNHEVYVRVTEETSATYINYRVFHEERYKSLCLLNWQEGFL